MSKISDDIVIRFADVAVQPAPNTDMGIEVPITRLIGFVPVRYLLPLFDNAGLAANPRSSRRNSVVEDILSTLNTSADLFRYKSKGVLIGSSKYEALQRNRYRLAFNDPQIEGILDGGHNMLAIGLYILQPLMEDKEWKRLKSWDDMKAAWHDHRGDIESAVKSDLERPEDQRIFGFYVPVEILVPSGPTEEERDDFLMPLLEVCEARNNNAQLPIEAKANKQGFYEAIKELVPPEFAARVEWKPNSWDDDTENRPIKVRDLIALAWIPLNLLNEEGALPLDISVSPQNTYRNKGECSKRFEELMSDDRVTDQMQGAQRSLKHEGVRSAFKVLTDLPLLYDYIYENFPRAYNEGNRRFGANPIVKIYDPERRKNAKAAGKDVSGYVTTEPKTPFFRKGVSNNYPEGLIVPLIYGLKGLMEVKEGKVRWLVENPIDFLKEYLARIADSYQLVMNMARWDPQKISKDPNSYEFAVREFRSALHESKVALKDRFLL
ncbi:hypothetical protein [Hyphomonas sp.]|uniref:hypothetical protein n=1 Tax=Hyphomonas sp. TaxID=87 RepID=UPI003001FDC2